jgi:hypothetical protein
MWKTIDPIIVMPTSCLRRQLPRHIKRVDLFLVVDIFLNAKDCSECEIFMYNAICDDKIIAYYKDAYDNVSI